MKRIILFFSALTACGAALGACSSDSSSSTAQCEAYKAPASVPATKVTRAEIDVIFERSCSFTTCHGASPGSGQLYIPKRASGDWHPELVNRASTRLPSMKRVTAGDPAASFLVHKLNAKNLCALDAQCTGGKCGEQMPEGGDALAPAEYEKIVAWIQQGAPAN